MNMNSNGINKLADFVKQANARKGVWEDGTFEEPSLAWQINKFLWSQYDPGYVANRGFIYPNINVRWGDLLEETMSNNGYGSLTKDEVLSILFGAHHKDRIAGGLWLGMFERGVAQKLLGRLLELESSPSIDELAVELKKQSPLEAESIDAAASFLNRHLR